MAHETIAVTYDPIKPDHYKRWGNFEPIKVIRAWRLNFNLGNAIKYISRAGYKDGNSMIQDLEKAKEYLEIEIAMLKEDCDESVKTVSRR